MMIGEADTGPVSADDALARLMAGNQRFLLGEPRNLRAPKEVLAGLAEVQRPYATILGCSDSRVPPELIFDAGFGDLFIIRVAGNVISAEVMGSIQYAAAHLATSLIVVLGHEGCGAVQAALAAKFEGAKEGARIELLLRSIVPGLDSVDRGQSAAEQISRAVEANVIWSVRQLATTPEARERVAEGRLRIVGAVCETATGRVRLLDEAGDGPGRVPRGPSGRVITSP
jgi:carbonic anhydrase